jgi:hypothetical protein
MNNIIDNAVEDGKQNLALKSIGDGLTFIENEEDFYKSNANNGLLTTIVIALLSKGYDFTTKNRELDDKGCKKVVIKAQKMLRNIRFDKHAEFINERSVYLGYEIVKKMDIK